MLEGILYFVLGFLGAGLLALMISPVIWNRAVVLTKKRIESSVPLTLNEIQADKDQLRAEFAMSTRRLEMSIEELREKAATQVIEINRKRDDLARLAGESRERVESVGELETRGSELRSLLRQREEALARANEQYEEMQRRLEMQALEHEQLRNELSGAKIDADRQKIELVAKDTAMENLTEKMNSFSAGDNELAIQLQATIKESAEYKSELAAMRQQNQAIQERMDRYVRQLADAEEKLQRRERDLSDIRKSSNDGDGTNSELTSQVVDEKAKNIELSAKLAQANLQMEALLSDASNENVKAAISSVKAEKDRIADELVAVTKERDDLKQGLKSVENRKVDDWEVERRENAVLRERINDLAAQVTSMTASIEGKNSPINKILADGEKAAKENGDIPKRGKAAPANTLADRIRALQDSARAANK